MKLRSSMKIYWRMGGISTRRSRFLVCLVFFCCFCVGISYAQNSQLSAGQIMRDYEHLVSPNMNFQLLFFSPAGTMKRYVGIQHNIWDTGIPTAGYIWVANRENPVEDTSGVLNITQEGNMVLSYSRGPIITVNSKQPAASANTTLSLQDSGNLILKAGDQIVWQSFDYPSHTLLPGMKLGIFGLKTGSPPQKKFLTSWLTPMVAAAGAFTLGINPNNTRELVIWRRDVLYRRIGIWNGTIFTDYSSTLNAFNFSYHSNENDSYYTISSLNPIPDLNGVGVWMTMNPTGSFVMYAHGFYDRVSIETCDDKRGKFYQGCVRPEPSNCKMGDDFSQKSGEYYVIQGQLNDYQQDVNLSISDCKEICKKNCSCTSYMSGSDDGTGCMFPSAQQTSMSSNGTYYIRNKDRPRNRWLSWLIISGPVVVSLLVLSLLLGYLGMRRKKRSTSQGDTELIMNELNASMAKVDKLSGAHKVDLRGKKDHELPIFKFSTIQVATDHFSDANKLGQGGFGPVYKGKLVDGQEIAVKRLAKRSGQGLEEFKNEVMLISKLQHRNLVRVLGCCIQGEERILIYEYLPNKSLDYFLFDATKRALLDWKKRLCIIEGIAQGLLYLHMYSRFKIIHRDLKTSNILLDSNMNPKISDFGTARIFGEDESLANTNRIVGTRGYMSPEYAMDGIFSEKSDVFSFGVMMLEIVCGMKNSGFYESDRHLNLLDYAWDLWKEGRCMELMNRELLDEICSTDDVMRYIQVGLLCVQESAADRPTMSDVLPMLSNKLMSLPTPKQPAFSAISGIDDHNADLPQNPTPCSINDVSLSELVAR